MKVKIFNKETGPIISNFLMEAGSLIFPLLFACAMTYYLFADGTLALKDTSALLMVIVYSFAEAFWGLVSNSHHKKLFFRLVKLALFSYVIIVVFAIEYKSAGLLYGVDNTSHDPLDALYFSIVTWTTLGYGDFQPTEAIRFFAAIEALLGTLLMPLCLASVLFAAQRKYSSNGKQD